MLVKALGEGAVVTSCEGFERHLPKSFGPVGDAAFNGLLQ